MNNNEGVSIIIPTLREAQNVPELVKRIHDSVSYHHKLEVILMDDNSQDGIQDVVTNLREHYPWLYLIVRKEKKGLSAAVLEGFEHARYPILVVMDADLSHPPEKIQDMLMALSDPQVDFVVGSRYVQGGSSDEEWSLTRKIISRSSAMLAWPLLGSAVRDPLSGFFAVRASLLRSGGKLNPIGWKIGLEIMVKCRCKNIKEAPIHFSNRAKGKSKLNVKIALDYVRHVQKLMVYKFL